MTDLFFLVSDNFFTFKRFKFQLNKYSRLRWSGTVFCFVSLNHFFKVAGVQAENKRLTEPLKKAKEELQRLKGPVSRDFVQIIQML